VSERVAVELDRQDPSIFHAQAFHPEVGTELAQCPGQAVEVLLGRLGKRVEVTRRAGRAVQLGPDAPDDQVLNTVPVEALGDPEPVILAV
jgi:hypothetical protein